MKLAEDLRRSVLQAAREGKLTGGRCEGWRFVRLMDISLSIQYGYNAPAREKGSVKYVSVIYRTIIFSGITFLTVKFLNMRCKNTCLQKMIFSLRGREAL